jgi:hypothetical protein
VTKPGVPTNIVFAYIATTPNGPTCQFSYKPPTSDGGSPVTAYWDQNYQINPDGSRYPINGGYYQTGPDADPFGFSGFPKGTTEYVQIAAVNSAGMGPYSAWFSCEF